MVGKKKGPKPLESWIWEQRMAMSRRCVICRKPHKPKNRKGFYKWLTVRTCGLACRKKLSAQL